MMARRETATPYLVSTRDPWLSPHLEVMRSVIRDFNRMFEGLPVVPTSVQAITNWPRIEMFEREGRLIIRAEVPGVSKDDVKVRVLEDSLVIEGERRSEHEDRREGFYESEWNYGRFFRRIPLPAGADPSQVQAKFQNGVLEVTVNLPRPTTREIPIREEAGQGQGQSPGQSDRTLNEKQSDRDRQTERDRMEVAGSRERGGTRS
jgi:HSP20 family protein